MWGKWRDKQMERAVVDAEGEYGVGWAGSTHLKRERLGWASTDMSRLKG
jgi:hypothetical protein